MNEIIRLIIALVIVFSPVIGLKIVEKYPGKLSTFLYFFIWLFYLIIITYIILEFLRKRLKELINKK